MARYIFLKDAILEVELTDHISPGRDRFEFIGRWVWVRNISNNDEIRVPIEYSIFLKENNPEEIEYAIFLFFRKHYLANTLDKLGKENSPTIDDEYDSLFRKAPSKKKELQDDLIRLLHNVFRIQADMSFSIDDLIVSTGYPQTDLESALQYLERIKVVKKANNHFEITDKIRDEYRNLEVNHKMNAYENKHFQKKRGPASKKLLEFSVEELDRELIAGGAQIPLAELFKFKDSEGTPARNDVMARIKELYNSASSSSPNPAFASIDTRDLLKVLSFKTGQLEVGGIRGKWYDNLRMDCFDIEDERVIKNVHCVAAIMLKDNLIDEKNGSSRIRVKNYGNVFNLCEDEPYHDQPIVTGLVWSGFLVRKDIIATAGHCVRESTVKDLRIVFGYKMLTPDTPVIRVSNENIYNCVKIISLVYNPKSNGADWALVQLDREVQSQGTAALSKDAVAPLQPVYVIGHPVGLPLKYSPGARVRDLKDAFFVADLDLYMGNSGSPVFNSETHEVIGIVVRDDTIDFRWTGNCWRSIVYPNRFSRGSQCTRISELVDYNIESKTNMDTSNSIFISYSHKDKIYLDRLLVHLRPLQKDGIIDLWVDTKLKAGDKWKIEIENALKRARAAILLVSADFLASGFIVDNELPPLLKKAELEGTRIIPVILKPCRFTRDKNLSMFQAINDPSKPIIKFKPGEREIIYDQVAKEIEALMGEE